jgi:hypothetical protein
MSSAQKEHWKIVEDAIASSVPLNVHWQAFAFPYMGSQPAISQGG